MQLSQIIGEIEEFCPVSFAQDWDNVGLLVGRRDKEVHRILLALDCTGSVIEEARERRADLILTHHPLIFRPLKRVDDSDYVGRRVMDLIRLDIPLYAMHTNFDILGMADAAADLLNLGDRRVLEVTYEDELSTEGLGRIGTLAEHQTLGDFAEFVREAFSVDSLRVYGDMDQPIVTCAVLPGSGADEIDLAVKEGADVYITGDVSHHDGLDAVEKGLALIDAGHFGVEKLFLPYMKDYFAREMPGVEILLSVQDEPYEIV